MELRIWLKQGEEKSLLGRIVDILEEVRKHLSRQKVRKFNKKVREFDQKHHKFAIKVHKLSKYEAKCEEKRPEFYKYRGASAVPPLCTSFRNYKSILNKVPKFDKNWYKVPKNSILARNFSLSQGKKDKSCPGQEIRETRTRFQSCRKQKLLALVVSLLLGGFCTLFRLTV